MLHVVLFRPLIPANTGNIGRTCLGFGARLHPIKPLGFELSEREVKRAGLDHWNDVDLTVHDSWRCFTETTLPSLGRSERGAATGTSNIYLVSKRLKLGSTPIADVDFFPRTPPLPEAPGERVLGGSSDGEASGRLDFAPTLGGGGDSSSGGDGGGSLSEDVALVFGNEVDGLSGLEEGALGRSLPAVFLPMRDDVIRSYNLANAVAMAVYEVDRQRRASRRASEKSVSDVESVEAFPASLSPLVQREARTNGAAEADKFEENIDQGSSGVTYTVSSRLHRV
eukprot:g8356.t2